MKALNRTGRLWLRLLPVLALALLVGGADGCGPEDTPEGVVLNKLNGSWRGDATRTQYGTTDGSLFLNRGGTYQHGSRSGGQAYSEGKFTLRLYDDDTFEITYVPTEGQQILPDRGRFEHSTILTLQSTTEGSEPRLYSRSL